MPTIMTTQGISALRKRLLKWDEMKRDALQEAGVAASQDSNAWHDNFVYEDGMRRQAMYAHEVRRMHDILCSAQLVPAPETNDTVMVGHRVQMRLAGQLTTYIVVGQGEAGLFSASVSTSSPLGRTLLGMRKGEQRRFFVTTRQITVEVVDIEIAREEDYVLSA